MNIRDVQKEYNILKGQQPKVGDMVFIPSQGIVRDVAHVDKMLVKIYVSDRVSMTLPPSQYMLLEKREDVDHD